MQEGLEVFDDHQEQYDTTDPANTNAREKLESQVGHLRQRAACTGRRLQHPPGQAVC